MSKYIAGHIIEGLKDALKCSKLESANFSTICPEDKYPTNEREVDQFIKNRIRLHYETWIQSPLERAIEHLEEFNEQAKPKKRSS